VVSRIKFTVEVRLTELADPWSTPLIETIKMNTELGSNTSGVKVKHQIPEAQRMPDTQQ
jgi:hypothetical protein